MKSKMNRFYTTIFALASIALSHSALAGPDLPDPPLTRDFDAKMYPGSSCQPYHGTQAFHFLTFQNGIAPRLLRNASDSHPDALWVSCPIIRDNTRNTNGTWTWLSADDQTGVDVWVDVPAGSDESLLKCHLMSYELTGGGRVADHENVTPKKLQDGRFVLHMNVNLSADPGYYYLRCYLPWESTLRAYRVTEYLPTDDNS